MAQKPSLPKGTRDFLPEVMRRREYLFDTIRTVFRKYGYGPIETPALERLDVLTGKYGEEGERLMFKILNNGDFLAKATQFEDAQKLSHEISSRALRYDLTVPFARFVVMNQHALNFPFKRYQIQPVWRADRPQKGRYREFYQCDADVVGSDSLLFEAEFIAIYDEALSALGFDDFSIRLNHRKILAAYAEVMGQPEKFADICTAIDKLDKIGEAGVRNELLNRGVAAEAADPLFAMIGVEGSNEEKLAALETHFAQSESGQAGLRELREVFALHAHLSRFQGKVVFDPKLARGLDYYTGTVFEVQVHNAQMGSIGGGGRYADLTGVFGLTGLSGVGISFGAERIYDVMETLGLFGDLQGSGTEVLLVNFGEETLAATLAAADQLRRAGIAVEVYPEAAKFKKQFSYANKQNIPFTLVIGKDELASGTYQLKHMESGEQKALPLPEVVAAIEAARQG